MFTSNILITSGMVVRSRCAGLSVVERKQSGEWQKCMADKRCLSKKVSESLGSNRRKTTEDHTGLPRTDTDHLIESIIVILVGITQYLIYIFNSIYMLYIFLNDMLDFLSHLD